MKKNRITSVLLTVAVLAGSLLVFAGCTNNKSVNEETVSLNQAAAQPATVKSGEVISVTPDEAINIALKNAGVERKNATFFGAPSIDEENGIAHYNIEFTAGIFDYEYEIAVNNGSILKAEKDEKIAQVAVSDPTVSQQKPAQTPDKPNSYIGIEEAKSFALAHAEINAADATFRKAEYDSDDLIPHYDIKFVSGGYEYDYEIMASDGSVLERDIERDEGKVHAPSADSNTNYISAQEAKEAAYAHAGVKSADVKFVEAEIDRDDAIVHYDIDFRAGKFEYEYEVNAKTGKVIASEKEIND